MAFPIDSILLLNNENESTSIILPSSFDIDFEQGLIFSVIAGYKNLAKSYNEKYPSIRMDDKRIIYFNDFLYEFIQQKYTLIFLTKPYIELSAELVNIWMIIIWKLILYSAKQKNNLLLEDKFNIEFFSHIFSEIKDKDLKTIEKELLNYSIELDREVQSFITNYPKDNFEDLETFYIAFDYGLCLYDHRKLIENKNIDSDQILPALLSAFREISKKVLSEEVRFIEFSRKQIALRCLNISEKINLLFIFVSNKPINQRNMEIFLEIVCVVFVSKYREILNNIESKVHTSDIFTSFYPIMSYLLSSPLKLLIQNYPIIDSPQGRLQLIINELIHHIPSEYIMVSDDLIRLSQSRIMVPIDISLKKTELILNTLEKFVNENFGKKIFDMAVKKAERKMKKTIQ